MASAGVVPALEVFEDCEAGVALSRKRATVEQLTLEGCEEEAVALEKALGLPPGRLADGGIISIVDDVALRAPRSPLSGNDFFLDSGGKGLPGGGPEINIAPINTAGGGGVRQVILDVR